MQGSRYGWTSCRQLVKRMIDMKPFTPNKIFRRDYDRAFKKDPMAANFLLLLCELANERGQVVIADEQEIIDLMTARFGDRIGEYQL